MGAITHRLLEAVLVYTLEDYFMYYDNKELTQALERARVKIDKITERTSEYTRGTNDCLALLMTYDEELREGSKARDFISFRWKSTREFIVKLARAGYTLEDYATECGYEVISSKRPLLGDIAFGTVAMVNDGSFWVSTNEDNTGTRNVSQTLFLERNIKVLARPVRG